MSLQEVEQALHTLSLEDLKHLRFFVNKRIDDIQGAPPVIQPIRMKLVDFQISEIARLKARYRKIQTPDQLITEDEPHYNRVDKSN